MLSEERLRVTQKNPQSSILDALNTGDRYGRLVNTIDGKLLKPTHSHLMPGYPADKISANRK